MAGKVLFYYFGDDEAYFRALSGEFGKHTRLQLEFKRIFETKEKNIQSLFLKVHQDKPSCVFIDFSKHTQDYLHLARIIARTPTDHQMITVGLVDYLSPQEVLMESIATGVNLTHIKSAETYDVVYDVTKLIAPNEIGEHGFAVASLKETWGAGVPVKVGYVHKEGLHFETDFQLSKGDRIRINHHWLEKRIVPSKECFIQNISKKNLFYHFENAVDAEFLFIDEFLPPEGMEEVDIIERKKERNELIIYHKKQLKRWIEDNESSSLEKKAKVLIVDREFHFYHDQQRTDKHPYTIRCVPYLENVELELDRLEPQVIAFALENEDVTDARNNNEALHSFMTVLKRKGYQSPPFVVVFNSKISSREIQESFSYNNIMATDHELAVDVLVRMAEIFEKKLNDSLGQIKAKANEEKVFLRKTNSASIAEILIEINVLKLSESNMVFQCGIDLPIGINLHLTTPVNMFINVQPAKTQGKVPEYHGLIHCLGEEQKKELRRFVNSVFFRDHDAKVTAETEEFKKLNEKKLQEKEKAIKAAMAAEEKKALEAQEAANNDASAGTDEG